ncbi:MAG: AAA family ATPase [Patescibacteria group bacterium]|nr:AAA family ATPase [Patescibacteria group bacterium]
MGFQKAVKRDAKLRLALCGPAGSGKTYSLLSIATELGGPIAYVDTEHGSASKYADLFQFDVIEPDVFDPRKLIELIKEAIEAGYRVVCIDSLSHYWMGKGGELDMVDGAAKRTQGNSFAAWKHVTPVHNELVDTIIGAQIHVLVSMRTKTEWVIEKDERTGKNAPRKVGLAPVMRDGIEFEFDVCGDLDQDNTLTVTKSRCPDLAGKVINRPGKDMAQTLKKWLTGAPVEPKAAQPQDPAATAPAVNGGPKQPYQATDEDLPTNMGGTWQDPDPNHNEKKVAEMRQRAAESQTNTVGTPATAPAGKPWTTFKGMIECFTGQHQRLGDEAYHRVLGEHGVKHANEFKSSQAAQECYTALLGLNTEVAA